MSSALFQAVEYVLEDVQSLDADHWSLEVRMRPRVEGPAVAIVVPDRRKASELAAQLGLPPVPEAGVAPRRWVGSNHGVPVTVVATARTPGWPAALPEGEDLT